MRLRRWMAVALSLLGALAMTSAAGTAASAVPASTAPGTSYGPADAMHLQVTGSAATGLAAEIYDGSTASDEVAATPMSKEFKLTAASSGYPYPLGSSELIRQGYGWNTGFVAFALSLGRAGADGVAGRGTTGTP